MMNGWKYRRAFMFATVAFCMAIIVMGLFIRPDAPAASMAIKMAFGVIGTVLAAYVFGAVWDDKGRKS